jgi:hypothetical protein
MVTLQDVFELLKSIEVRLENIERRLENIAPGSDECCECCECCEEDDVAEPWTKQMRDMIDEAYEGKKPTVVLCELDPPFIGWSRKGSPIFGDKRDSCPICEIYNSLGEMYVVIFNWEEIDHPTIIINGKPFNCGIESVELYTCSIDPNTGIMVNIEDN